MLAICAEKLRQACLAMLRAQIPMLRACPSEALAEQVPAIARPLLVRTVPPLSGKIDTLRKFLSIFAEQMEEIAMRQNLRDNSGNLLGWRQQVGRRINGYTAAGWPVGWFDPVMNATHNINGHRIGTGDLLATLILGGR